MSVVTRGRVVHVSEDGGVMVAIELGREYGGHLIKARPLPGDDPIIFDSSVYVEIESPPGSGRSPRWARIVDPPPTMRTVDLSFSSRDDPAVWVDRDVLARHELADRVKAAVVTAVNEIMSYCEQTPDITAKDVARIAAAVILASDLRAAAAPAESTEEKAMPEIITQRGAGSYCGECGVPICQHVASIRASSGQTFQDGYSAGGSDVLADVETLCDQIGVDADGKSPLEAIRAEVLTTREQLDDATAEVARLARRLVEAGEWADGAARTEKDLHDDLERRKAALDRAIRLAYAFWSPDRGLRESMPGWLFGSNARWPDVVRWVSDSPTSVDEPEGEAVPEGIDPDMWDSAMSFFSGDRVLAEKSCRRQIAAKSNVSDEPEDKPDSEVTAGEVDGWRWWRVEDAPDDGWLVYDNRPMVEAWSTEHETWSKISGERPEIRQCPKLVQGRVPWAVVREATGS